MSLTRATRFQRPTSEVAMITAERSVPPAAQARLVVLDAALPQCPCFDRSNVLFTKMLPGLHHRLGIECERESTISLGQGARP